jgi:hypothetical protein
MTSLATEEGVSRVLMTNIETSINDNSKDLDFRVESNNQSEMLLVNAGTDKVGIKGNPAGVNGVLQVTGSIGLTGSAEIRQSTNADDGSTLRFLGTQLVIANSNANGYGYSGGGFIAAVSPSAGSITLDVGANSTSGHRLNLTNAGDGVQGTLNYKSGSNNRFSINSSSGEITVGNSTQATTMVQLNHENSTGKGELQLNAHGTASFSMLSNFTGSTVSGVATGNFGLITPHNAGISIVTSDLERMKIDGSGHTVFNETGADADFRIESNDNANMFHVDAGSNAVGIGTTGNGPTPLTVNGGTATAATIQLGNHGDNAGIHAKYSLAIKADSTEAISDRSIEFKIGTHQAFYSTVAGTVFNEAGADADFRVESSGNANMLFVDGGNDAVGVGTGSPSGSGLHVYNSSAGEQYISSSNSALRFVSTGGANYIQSGTATSSSSAADLIFTNVGGTGEVFRIAADGSLSTPTAGTSNVRFGVNAGNSITSGGNYNVVVGDNAGTALTTGDGNVAFGYSSLLVEDTGQYSTALGYETLANQNNNAANYNTAVGASAGQAVTTGVQNTFIGALSGDATTDADYNVGVGIGTLGANVLGSKSTAIGTNALFSQKPVDGSGNDEATDMFNVGLGYHAGFAVTTGTNNTLIGGLAGDAINTGTLNTILGASSGSGITTGAGNTLLGYAAGGVESTGSNNVIIGQAGQAQTLTSDTVAVGDGALQTNTKSAKNTAIGRSSLRTLNHTSATDAYNTALGYNSGYAVTTGVQNTLIGGLAGDALTNGTQNVILGYKAGTHATNLEDGIGNVLLGNLACTTATNSIYANVIGFDVAGATNYTTLGKGTDDIRAAHGNVTWATVSDERYKKDIVDSTAGLSFINALQPRTFKYKNLGELPETFSAYEADSTEVFKNSNTNHGFIAQEIKAAIDADSSIKDGFRLWDDREDGSQEVAEAALIPILVKAIQELTARIETLEG